MGLKTPFSLHGICTFREVKNVWYDRWFGAKYHCSLDLQGLSNSYVRR